MCSQSPTTTNRSQCLLVLPLLLVLVILSGHGAISVATNVSTTPQSIRVVMDNNYPPYAFLGQGGELQGITIDQWRLWLQKTGIHVHMTGMTWEEAQRRMKAGEFDVIDTMFRNERREQLYDFTKPYAIIPVPLFFHTDISGIHGPADAAGFMVAAKSGGNVLEVLKQHGVTNIVEYPSYEKIIEAARDGQVKVFTVDRPPALHYLHKMAIRERFRETPPMYSGELHRAVIKGNTALLNIIQAGFDQFSDEELREIDKNWIGSPLLTPVQTRYFLIGGGLFGLLFGTLFLWNYSLRQAVTRRTRELRDNEAHLRKMVDVNAALAVVFEAVGHPMLILYPDHTIIAANEASLKVTGKHNHEILGRKCYEIFHGAQAQAPPASCPMEAMIQSGSLETIEMEMEALGCMYFISCTPVFNKEGLLEKVIHLATDITERKRAEEALRRNEGLLRAVLDSIPDLVWLKDPNGVYLACNPMLERFLGAGAEKILGKSDYEFLDQEQADGRRAHDRKTIAAAKPCRDEGWITLADNGQRLLLDTVKTPMYDADGALIGVLGIGRDITEQNRLQSQLAGAHRMESIGRLAGGVAHDFNNMLGIILGYAELGLEKVEKSGPLHEYFQQIFDAGLRSSRITKQLLAFARKQEISPQILSLNEAVGGILKMLRRLIGEDIHLIWLPKTGLPSIKMDPAQLDQVLANLCINSRDAISGIGKITLKTDKRTFDRAFCARHTDYLPGNFVLLEVSDTGCGMDQETLANIFEPFYTTKQLGQGTGLGLATVYGIVRQNKGFILVSSDPGQGTTFKIYFPVNQMEQNRVSETTARHPPSGKGEMILVVEDEPELLELCRTILEKFGYTVLAASKPYEALQIAHEHAEKIALLISDVVMPEMNGRDLSDRVRALCPQLNILFMSGYTADVIAHRGMLAEGVHFIAKPFSATDLVDKVQALLG